MIKKILGLMLVCLSFFAQAQQTRMADEPQMADVFREEGKIYVVISVIAIIFLALVGFLIMIERRLKKMEDKLNDK